MKALEAIAVGGDGGAFTEVEVSAHPFVCVDAMVEVGDERRNGALEVNVVLPKRVVRVKQEMLVLQLRDGFSLRCDCRWRHRLILNTRRKAALPVVVSAE